MTFPDFTPVQTAMADFQQAEKDAISSAGANDAAQAALQDASKTAAGTASDLQTKLQALDDKAGALQTATAAFKASVDQLLAPQSGSGS